jgi:hypothetical protein
VLLAYDGIQTQALMDADKSGCISKEEFVERAPALVQDMMGGGALPSDGDWCRYSLMTRLY